MIRVLAITALISGFCLAASASDIGLADWCVNVNGDINTACNGGTGGTGGLGMGGTAADGSIIDLSAFDTTLEPSTNNLGTITITLGPGTDQSALVYMDYDLDYPNLGSFDDSAPTPGSAPANVSYELDDPNTSNIFGDFATGTPLPDTDNVVTPGGPPNQCCDVAWALGLGGIDVDAGDTEVVTFTVGTTAPAGFYLEQINQTTGEKIYLSESAACVGSCGGGGGTPGVPEPRQEALLLVVLSIIFIAVRKKKQQAL